MTLAVAAVFPWQAVLDSMSSEILTTLQHLGLPKQAILFAADSRWTYTNDGSHEDGGVKLFGLGANAIAIYAGNVAAGERSIIALEKHFSDKPPKTETETYERMRDVLRGIWSQHHHDGGGLYLLIGSSWFDGSCALMQFRHDIDFEPERVSGVQAIGSQRAIDYFLDELNEMTRRVASGPSPEVNPEGWVGRIAVLVNNCAERGVDDTVGGQVLCAYVMDGQVHSRAITKINISREPPEVEGEITLAITEAKSYYERWRHLLPPFPGPLAFGEVP